MTKRQIIDEILSVNPTAQPEFLAKFEDGDLGEYLSHLQVLQTPRLTGDASRYNRYFTPVRPSAPVPAKAGDAGVTVQEKHELMESSGEAVASDEPIEAAPVYRALAPAALMKQTPFASSTVNAASLLF